MTHFKCLRHVVFFFFYFTQKHVETFLALVIHLSGHRCFPVDFSPQNQKSCADAFVLSTPRNCCPDLQWSFGISWCFWKSGGVYPCVLVKFTGILNLSWPPPNYPATSGYSITCTICSTFFPWSLLHWRERSHVTCLAKYRQMARTNVTVLLMACFAAGLILLFITFALFFDLKITV